MIVLGSGLAGLTVALELADSHDVIVLSKRSLQESATSWAQGGIVGVIDELDNIDSHVSDTVKAGAGLVDREVAQTIALHSTSAIEWLIDRGVPFTSDPDGPKGLHLVREGGHS
ncbi:MAG: FAD-dependent oxidoreductase, partial [Burkholderiaceae bacterium]